MDLKEKFQSKRFFYLYRGVVTNNDDPKKGGRVQVRIFELHGLPESATPGNYEVSSGEKDSKFNFVEESNLPWAEVMQGIGYIGFWPAPGDGQDEFAANIDGKGGKSAYKTITRSGKHSGMGQNVILTPGTWVFCILENGNPNYPIVIGTVAADSEMHKNTKPKNTRIFDSITGHYEEWSDEDGKIIFHHRSGTTITFDENGNLYFNTVNTKKEYVQADSNLHIDGNCNEYTKGDVKEIMDSNHTLDVTKDEVINIKGNRTRSVKGAENISIQSNQNINVSGNKTESTSGNHVISANAIFLN